jgi:hypothetical protein
MLPSHLTYNSLIQLFDSNLFYPEYNTLYDKEDEFADIYIIFKIELNTYTVRIDFNGRIQCSIKNEMFKEHVDNCELSTIFNCVNRLNSSYKNPPTPKLFNYIDFKYN